MVDLIQQMNVLKNLSDDQLAAELQSPTGGAAPFMVASELNRRKDMRDRYMAQAASRRPQTTVAADLLGSMGGPSQAQPMGQPGMPDPASAGMPAPPPQGIPGAPPQGMPAFASGGIVDALDYGQLTKSYQDDLNESAKAKDRAAGMALLAAAAGIMGAGHSNTLSNVGAGLSAGLSSYQDALKTADTSRSNALEGLALLSASQHNDALTRLQLDQSARIAQEQLDAPTANIKDHEYRKKLSPEEQAQWDLENPPYNSNAMTNEMRISAAIDKIYADAQKKYPITGFEIDDNEIANKQRKAQLDAYNRIKAAYGPEIADDWAKGMGVATGDLVTMDAGGVDPSGDFLNIGLTPGN